MAVEATLFFSQQFSSRADDPTSMKRIAAAVTISLVFAFAGCRVKDPLYCDENTPCTDSNRPFCDLNGEYPGSDGIGRTCIADPFGDSDGGVGGDSGAGRSVVQLATAGTTSCAVLSDGGLRCWGDAKLGGEHIGDNEPPRAAGDIETGGPIAQVAVADDHICVRYQAGGVRCWGENDYGQLGYGHTDPISSPPAELPDIQLGAPASLVTAGATLTCAVIEGGDVRCWGQNNAGQLGYGDTEPIGDDEVPTDHADPVSLGGAVRDLSCGDGSCCAVLEAGGVRCWGANYMGRLGYGTSDNVGDNETPEEAGFVNVGGGAESVGVGPYNSCVVLTGGSVRCWGAKTALGIPGSSEAIGDNEAPASIGPVETGGNARQVISGVSFVCAVLESDSVVCWGSGGFGQLGYGSDDTVGDGETPAEQGPVMLGGKVREMSFGTSQRHHSCAVLDSGVVRCWGLNDDGQLGLGYAIDSVGDDETPDSKDPIEILD